MKSRMDRSRLNIGTYILQPYARTEQHVKDMKECGIDFVTCVNYDRKLLDLFAKYGIGADVSGVVPGWWGEEGENGGKMSETCTPDKYVDAASKFIDHPAIWAIDVGDEPSALDFPYYGKAIALTQKLFPKQFVYLNLYPNVASADSPDKPYSQLGTKTYEEHIASYCENVPLDYICYDYYPYAYKKEGRPYFGLDNCYENLRVVADACAKTGRSMWIVLQVNSNVEDKTMSLNQLRFQAFLAMAFGAENIIWGCYTAGWWFNNVLDTNGEKTEQYDKLKQMNAEIRAMADDYMRYRRTVTHLIGYTVGQPLEGVGLKPVSEVNTGVFKGLRAGDGASLAVGEMVSRSGDGSNALFIFAADDPSDENSKTTKVTFRADQRCVTVVTPEGRYTPDRDDSGEYSLELVSNTAALIIAE